MKILQSMFLLYVFIFLTMLLVNLDLILVHKKNALIQKQTLKDYDMTTLRNSLLICYELQPSKGKERFINKSMIHFCKHINNFVCDSLQTKSPDHKGTEFLVDWKPRPWGV